MPSILIVDDEAAHARALARFFERRRCSARVAVSAAEARAALGEGRPDLILLDQRLGHEDGIALLRETLASDPDLPVIMMTAYGSVDTAVAAMKAGARDYVQKPVDLEELALVVDRALAEAHTRACLEHLQREPGDAGEGPVLLGSSRALEPTRELLARMRTLGTLPAGEYPTILLLGETGTGKSLVARALHRVSPLARGPFLTLDCTAVPRDLMEAELFGYERGAFTDAKTAKPGLLEVAAGGTVFLDEIGELSLAAQAKLLRVLEEKTLRRLGGLAEVGVDVHVIAATNRNPKAEVEAGRFRQDLLYRLDVLSLTLPPLRERGDDVLVLAEHFLVVFARKYGRPVKRLTPEAAARLRADRWVGNVRELAHVIERVTLLVDGDTIEAHHLGREGASAPEVADPVGTPRLQDAERDLIARVLEESGGNVSQAARRLGVSRELLRYRMRKYGLR